MNLNHYDRWWLLLCGCLIGLLVPAVVAPAASGADYLVAPMAAVAVVALFFFLSYGLQRLLAAGPEAERDPYGTVNKHRSLATVAKAQIAEQQQGSSRLIRDVLDGLDTQVCILDEAGQIIETNLAWDRFVDKVGTNGNGRIGSIFSDFYRSLSVGEDAEQVADSATGVASGRLEAISCELKVLIDGMERLHSVRIKRVPHHEHGTAIVLQEDHTEANESQRQILLEKRKAETLASALETSQTSLELAMKGGELGLWHWDVDSGYFELSVDWLERLGHNERSLNADIDSFRELLHVDELCFWTADDAASLTADEPYDRQFRLRRPDGSYKWVHVLGRSNATNPDGSPESLSGILFDIDARKRTELRDAGMARIIEDSINEVYIVDRQTLRFLEVNRGARENLGYSLEELRQLSPPSIKLAGTLDEFSDRINSLTTGRLERLEFETMHVRKDGSTYPVIMNVQAARLLDRDVFVAIGSDLSQRRELETQLAEAQRLESIGQLAAGVAHEMNTPLQFVGNNVSFLSDCSDALFEVIDLCQNQLDADPLSWKERQEAIREAMQRTSFDRIRAEAPKAIAESLEGIDRVLKIVRAMREFTHPGEEEMAPTDLNRALTSTATVTRNRWKEAAELELELDPYLPEVECFGAAMNQVFVNLIVNAADAIGERLEDDPSGPPGAITVRTISSDQSVQIEVIDNGAGMPEEVQRRVFDPFFTTKEVGKGTGQGLSLSHAIVTQKHRGQLAVESIPGEGTTMRVTLPVSGSASRGHSTQALPRTTSPAL